MWSCLQQGWGTPTGDPIAPIIKVSSKYGTNGKNAGYNTMYRNWKRGNTR